MTTFRYPETVPLCLDNLIDSIFRIATLGTPDDIPLLNEAIQFCRKELDCPEIYTNALEALIRWIEAEHERVEAYRNRAKE
jgi:hypothetical protein